jgi:hypothetical protein
VWEFMNRVRAEHRDAGVKGLVSKDVAMYEDICDLDPTSERCGSERVRWRPSTERAF